jgi:hypothetical protein
MKDGPCSSMLGVGVMQISSRQKMVSGKNHDVYQKDRTAEEYTSRIHRVLNNYKSVVSSACSICFYPALRWTNIRW